MASLALPANLDQIIEAEIIRRFNKAKWQSLLELYEEIAKEGIIFGGAPRDYIARVTAAKDYYEFCEQNKIDADINYNNPEVSPDTFKDRNLYPEDIDVFISDEALAEFVKKACKKHVLVKKSSGPGHNYFFESNPLFKQALRLEKWEVSLINFSCAKAKMMLLGKSITTVKTLIRVDFVVIKNEFLNDGEYENFGMLYPPFGNPDFDVNQLMFKWDKEDSSLAVKPMPYIKRYFTSKINRRNFTRPLDKEREANILLESIVANIKAKHARAIYPDVKQYIKCNGSDYVFGIDSHRISKIKIKGYSFVPLDSIFPYGFKKFWAPNDYTYNHTHTHTSETASEVTVAGVSSKSGTVDLSAPKEEEDVCIICQDVFTADNRWFNCCKTCTGKMHINCFSQAQRNELVRTLSYVRCPHCRTETYDCNCKALTFINKLIWANITDGKDTFDRVCAEKCTECQEYLNFRLSPHCRCWLVQCRICAPPRQHLLEQID
jgi:hypothetical protein